MKMPSLFGLLLVLFAASAIASTPSDSATGASGTDHGPILVDWLRRRGGFVHDGVTVHTGASNSLFATHDIQEGEVLFEIPQSCLLKASNGPYTSDDSMSMCDTTRNLVREFYLGGRSEFAPYAQYVLNADNPTRLPSSWSEEAQQLLAHIIGDELQPQNVGEVDYFDICGDDLAELRTTLHNTVEINMESLTLLTQEAFRTVTARSWNEVLVPVFDMVNHRNGHWHNADQVSSVHQSEEAVTIVALRDIDAGEQVYISYNECNDTDCHGMAYEYVVPQIFKDYGFVEQYPRRWRFDTGEGEDPVIFDIEQDEETEELELSFSFQYPSDDQYEWLQWHLERLLGLESVVESRLSEIESSSERASIMEYHAALISALELALEQQEDGETGDDDDEEEDAEDDDDGEDDHDDENENDEDKVAEEAEHNEEDGDENSEEEEVESSLTQAALVE